MRSKTNRRQNVTQGPILLDRGEVSPVEKALQTEAARAAAKALKVRIDRNIAIGGALSSGRIPDFDWTQDF